MQEKIILDMLTQDSVSIKKQKVTTIDGVEYPIGDPFRKAYINSVNGREEIKTELVEPYLSVVILMWGNTPTIKDEIIATP